MKRILYLLTITVAVMLLCGCKGTRSITATHAEQHTTKADTANVAIATTTTTTTASQTNTIKIEFDTSDTTATSNSSGLLEWLFAHDTNVGSNGKAPTPPATLPRIKSIEATHTTTATTQQAGTTIEASHTTATESHATTADTTATMKGAATKEKPPNTALWLALILGILLLATGIYIGIKADHRT